MGRGGWVGAVCTFWYECPLVGLACESLHVCTVCIWRCEHARFCVEVFLCAIYKFSFIHSFTQPLTQNDMICRVKCCRKVEQLQDRIHIQPVRKLLVWRAVLKERYCRTPVNHIRCIWRDQNKPGSRALPMSMIR